MGRGGGGTPLEPPSLKDPISVGFRLLVRSRS